MRHPAAMRATAIASLRALIATRTASDVARESLQAIDLESYDIWRAIPPAIEDALVELIDAVLDAHGIAGYLLGCARRPGRIVFRGGHVYPIATVEDVEKLLVEQYPIEESAHG